MHHHIGDSGRGRRIIVERDERTDEAVHPDALTPEILAFHLAHRHKLIGALPHTCGTKVIRIQFVGEILRIEHIDHGIGIGIAHHCQVAVLVLHSIAIRIGVLFIGIVVHPCGERVGSRVKSCDSGAQHRRCILKLKAIERLKAQVSGLFQGPARIFDHEAVLLFRFYGREMEIVVIIAHPSPVDMIEVVTVETVDHKDMSTFFRSTSIEHGAAICYLIVNHIVPIDRCIRSAVSETVSGIEIKKFGECGADECESARRRFLSVNSSDGSSAIEQEVGNSLELGVRLIAHIRIEHVVPIDFGTLCD